MSRYRKKPVVVEAWPVRELNKAAHTDMNDLPVAVRAAYFKGGWVFGALKDDRRGIYVPTEEGSLFADPGDWIIRGVKGEFYPCKPDIFAATYEPADTPPSASSGTDDAQDARLIEECYAIAKHTWQTTKENNHLRPAVIAALAHYEAHRPCRVDGSTSDGFHTFDELYAHRTALFVALMRSHPSLSWRARWHDDGTMLPGGWFIAGMRLPSGDVTYHLPNSVWATIDGDGIETLDRAPKWDGHTADDVVDRLIAMPTPVHRPSVPATAKITWNERGERTVNGVVADAPSSSAPVELSAEERDDVLTDVLSRSDANPNVAGGRVKIYNRIIDATLAALARRAGGA